MVKHTHLRHDEEKVHFKDADNGDAVQRVVDHLKKSWLTLKG